MSDHMVSVDEALAWLDPHNGPKPEVPSPLLVDRYARTAIEQSETIQTLSRLLAGAEEAATERATQIERVRHALSGIARVRADYEAYLLRYDDHAEWYVATADALEYALTLIAEALEGDT